jgi:hypothetical protein
MGLKNFFTMVYYHDEETRSAFIQLLAVLVKQGFQLNETESEGTESDMEQLIGTLFKYDYEVLFTLTEVVKNNDKDELLEAVCKVFLPYDDHLLNLFEKTIYLEVENTVDSGKN